MIVDTFRSNGCDKFVLLKCTSAYPSTPADANINTIPHMAEMFDCQVGLSDHTMGVGVPLAAVALGATVIEKHFCLSRAEGGVDSAFSLEPAELQCLVTESERAWQSLGKVSYGSASDQEKKSKQFRRSIYFVKDMKAGDVISADCIRCVRPGYGLEPRYLEGIAGKKVVAPVTVGDRVQWECLN